MDNKQENQYRMGKQLVKLLTKRAAELAASEVATAEAADVQNAYAAVSASIGQGTTRTEANTATAEALQRRVLQVLPALLGPLRSVARKQLPNAAERAELLARATISATQLDKLRPGPLADVATHLLADATTYKAALKKYGYADAVHKVVKDAVDAFAATVGTTRTLQRESQGTHQSTTDLLREFMTQCYELDDAMQVFRVLDADLHRAYLRARKVGKSGGKGKGKSQGQGDADQAGAGSPGGQPA